MMRPLAFRVGGVPVFIELPAILCLAALFFTDPSPYTALVLLAAAGHEAGHLVALRLFRVRIGPIHIYPFGAVIGADTALLPPSKEAAAALAGIAVNACFAAVCLPLGLVLGQIYLLFFGAANAVLGAVNFFPVPSLDGARALACLLAEKLPPDRAETLSGIIGEIALLCLAALSVYLIHLGGGNFSLLIFCAALFLSLCR